MNENPPCVTVVVPAYNHQEYVVECIRSVLDQDYPNIDLLVINDGSTDATDPRIRDFMREECADFRYISKENQGLIQTLNLGLRLARGEFFCEIASDDLLLPGSIRKRVRYLLENPGIEAVFADAYLLEGSTPTTRRLVGDKGLYYRSAEHSVEDLITGPAVILFPSGMVRKKVLDEIGGFDEEFRYYEDMYMEYLLALRGRVGYLNEPVMYYREHSANVTKVFDRPRTRERILALEKLLRHSRGRSLRDAVKQELCRQYWKCFQRTGMDDKSERRRLLLRAIRLNPLHYKTLRFLFHLVF